MLALAGIALVVIGCFTPLARLGLAGSVTLYGHGAGDAPFVMALMIASLWLVSARHYRILILTALATAGIAALKLFDLRASAADPLSVLPVTYAWGWAPLVLGTVLLIAAGLIPPRASALA
ncbi:MAG: hypothetical protein JSR60_10660 [Proteobacteria bacterium]|nr:hypothetical protein [Pseudomonadota bacterium]